MEKKVHHLWDFWWLILYLVCVVIIFIGQLWGSLVLGIGTGILSAVFGTDKIMTDAWTTGILYLSFLGIWIAMLLVLLVFKKTRPVLKALGTSARGNNLKGLLIGLAIGFAANGICILGAWLHKDIMLYFDSFRPVSFILIFIAVFVQSSAEELVCRGFLYQMLMQRYGKPWFAIVFNSLLFALLHLGNNGVTILSLINIFLSGILFSLMVYYMDSLWAAFAGHAAWNFCQNIVFGLPNSGNVTPYSMIKLDASTAVDSFAYNVAFGVEGTVLADVVLFLCCIALWLWGRKYGKAGDRNS